MSLNACPVELLDAFVEECAHFGQFADLRRLRQVNKTFCALATPRAFRTIEFTSSVPSARSIRALLEEGQLAPYVKTLIFRSVRSHVDNQDMRIVDASEAISRDHVAFIFSHLGRFSSLSTLQIHFFPDLASRKEDMVITPEGFPDIVGPTRYYQLETLVLDTLMVSERPVSLKSLSLANLSSFIKLSYTKPTFKALLSSMTDLSFSFLSLHILGDMSDIVYQLFWTVVFTPSFLFPGTRTCLTSISLVSDMPVGEDSAIRFHMLHFPALCKLSLNGFVFDDACLLDTFILNHHATLTSLELNSCPMYFPDTVTLQVGRRWANLLGQFETSLVQLVEFRVLLRTGWGLDDLSVCEPERTCLTYESSSWGFGYERGCGLPPDPAVCAEDAAALERFQEVVRRRRLSM